MKGKCFESIQDIEPVMAARLKKFTKGISRTASEDSKNEWISVFKARGNILRGINVNVSFTLIF